MIAGWPPGGTLPQSPLDSERAGITDTGAPARFRLAGLFLLAVLLPGLARGQEGAAPSAVRYHIRVSEDVANVEGHFSGIARLDLTQIRLSGVQVELLEPEGGLRREQENILRLSIPSSTPIRYRVRDLGGGAIRRVPLFVPARPVPGGPAGVRITVTGISDVRGAFPKLIRRGDAATATLANVPSFVMIPPLRFGMTDKDLFDLAVVLLVCGATGAWLRGQRAGRREAED